MKCGCGSQQEKLRRGMCGTCYQRWRRNPPFDLQDRRSPEERFWAKVDTAGECWEWTGGKNPKGYGKVKLGGVLHQAHRASWVFAFGEIAPSLCVCHTCDNPSCVRPSHLFLGTYTDNVHDMIRKGRAAWQVGRQRLYYWRVAE